MNYSTHIIAGILYFDAIIHCSKITVEFCFGLLPRTRMPIIENWLNRTNSNGHEHNERFLSLKIHDDIPNLGEMFEYLKKVCHLTLGTIRYRYGTAAMGR